MTRVIRASIGVLAGLSCCLPATAQEKGRWQPLSTTARGITGALAFSEERLTISFLKFPIAEIRDLTPAELQVIATPDARGKNSAPAGHLYRLSIPAEQRFLNRNTLCGGEETQWIATAVQGKTLQIAVFSGAQMPILTAEAMSSATTLCGTFTYGR